MGHGSDVIKRGTLPRYHMDSHARRDCTFTVRCTLVDTGKPRRCRENEFLSLWLCDRPELYQEAYQEGFSGLPSQPEEVVALMLPTQRTFTL